MNLKFSRQKNSKKSVSIEFFQVLRLNDLAAVWFFDTLRKRVKSALLLTAEEKSRKSPIFRLYFEEASFKVIANVAYKSDSTYMNDSAQRTHSDTYKFATLTINEIN